jgi:hypothetical protein
MGSYSQLQQREEHASAHHLHGSSGLKASCFVFVQKSMAKILTNPFLAALAAKDAELWAELASNIV